MKPAVIFDFNGTMVFDGIYHEQAWKEFSKALRGQPFTDEEMQMMHGKPNVKIIEYLKPDVTFEEANKLSEAKEALYREIALQAGTQYHLVDGLEDFLNKLHDLNIPMNIASASILANIKFFIDVFRLDRWFDPQKIVYDDNTYENKIAMFKKAAANIRCDIRDCYVFEDSITGIRCAHEAKAKGIIVITHSNTADFPGVIKTIEDYLAMDEICALLK